jgi:hypothetical protein
MEDGEVKGKSKSNWVASVQRLGTGLCKLVVLESTVLNNVKLGVFCALCNISVVVTNHLIEEGFGFISGSNFHAFILDDFNNGDTLVVKLTFDLGLVFGESIVEFGVLWVLLDCTNGSNSSSLGANLVLESN